VKRLLNAADSLNLMNGRLKRLETRLGPVLYQLPPSLEPDLTRLADFAALLPANLIHVFEFRATGWFRGPIREILMQHGLCFCIHDWSGFECPLWATGPVVYIRLHGSASAEGRYSHDELRGWADRIREFLAEGRDVYAYFNNDAYGHAITNARELRNLVGADGPADPRP
jgi:uncharacterized protein YecE (DUF72 family)